MRITMGIRLLFAALFSLFVLHASSSWATTTTKNCPTEPTSNVSIASGVTYAGTNCVLHTADDVDSFVFSASDGDTYQTIVAYQGGTNGTCMALYDPNGNKVFPNTANPNNCTGAGDLVVPQTLTVTGTYTIDLTMQGNGSNGDYGLSLERINPSPSDAQQVTLAHAVTGTLTPPNEQVAYTFYGSTTGTYSVSANYTGGTNGTCVYLYYPGSATAEPTPDQGCTGAGVFQFTFKPPKDGTYLVLLTGDGDGSNADYSFEVSCYVGTCVPPPPTCALKDALTYDASTSTLTMNFTLATPVAATWDAWLVNHNTVTQLWSLSEPITDTAVKLTKTKTDVPKEGVVGVLSTLTVPTNTTTVGGITCSSWVDVSTGKP